MRDAEIRRRIHDSIQPVLDKADVLIESYMPDKYRVIGKHHPEYDTFGGQMHYMKRKLAQLENKWGRQVAQETYDVVQSWFGHIPAYTIMPPAFDGEKIT